MWDVILFDLDGTLTDPKEGITKSVAHALKHFGFHIEDLDSLTHFIGPPLCESFMRYYGLNEENAMNALSIYRERYASVGWKENEPYPGIPECLQQLKNSGKTLLIATSKAQLFAERILMYFGLDIYFDCICGTPMDDPNMTKSDVIRSALDRINITDLSRAVMVGDRLHDMDGGHQVGIATIGVLYGYGDRTELEQHRAEYIVESVSELRKLLLT